MMSPGGCSGKREEGGIPCGLSHDHSRWTPCSLRVSSRGIVIIIKSDIYAVNIMCLELIVLHIWN